MTAAEKTIQPQFFQVAVDDYPVFFVHVFQNIEIIHELPQANAFFQDVAVDMEQHVGSVEAQGGYAESERIVDMGKLFWRAGVEPALEATVRTGREHPTGREVNFDLGAFQNLRLAVDVARLSDGEMGFEKGHNLLPSALQPDVDIAALAEKWLWIQDAGRLSFEDAVLKAVLKE